MHQCDQCHLCMVFMKYEQRMFRIVHACVESSNCILYNLRYHKTAGETVFIQPD